LNELRTEAKDKKAVPARDKKEIFVDRKFIEKIEKTVTIQFFQTKISKGFIFENIQYVATGTASSFDKGIISISAHEAVSISEYTGDLKPMNEFDHFEAVERGERERGERERGYPGQIVTINKQEFVLISPSIEFKPKDK
jgi:hypothetical protein